MWGPRQVSKLTKFAVSLVYFLPDMRCYIHKLWPWTWQGEHDPTEKNHKVATSNPIVTSFCHHISFCFFAFLLPHQTMRRHQHSYSVSLSTNHLCGFAKPMHLQRALSVRQNGLHQKPQKPGGRRQRKHVSFHTCPNRLHHDMLHMGDILWKCLHVMAL